MTGALTSFVGRSDCWEGGHKSSLDDLSDNYQVKIIKKIHDFIYTRMETCHIRCFFCTVWSIIQSDGQILIPQFIQRAFSFDFSM